jgi:hypothetical protein
MHDGSQPRSQAAIIPLAATTLALIVLALADVVTLYGLEGLCSCEDFQNRLGG